MKPTRTQVLHSVFAIGPLFVVACGAPSAPPPKAVDAPRPTTKVEPPPDVSPVSPPKSLVAWGRVRKLSHVFEAAHSWTKLPAPGASAVAEIVTGAALGPICDLDQPIDFAVAMDSGASPVGAVSLALREPARARAAIQKRFKLVPGGGGIERIEGLGSDDDPRACALVPAFGPASRRLVCSADAAGVMAFAPYLARTLTRSELPEELDARVEIAPAPIKDLLRSYQRYAGAAPGMLLRGRTVSWETRALLVAAARDVFDLARDLDRATWEIRVGDKGARSTLTMRLTGHDALLSRLAVSHPERVAPPPVAFFRLPADAGAAWFHRGVDAADFEPFRGAAGKLLAEQLAEVNVSPKDRDAVAAAVSRLIPSAASVVALGTEASVPGGPDMPWCLVAIDEPIGTFQKGVGDLVGALGKPSVVRSLRPLGPRAPRLRSLSLRKGALPDGTIGLELQVADPHGAAVERGKVPSALLVTAYFVPDGSRTWIGAGMDAKTLATRMVGVLADKPAAQLQGRADLLGLKGQEVGAGGFFTYRALSSALGKGRSLDGPERRTPHGGASPVIFGVRAISDSNVEIVLDVPRGAFEDGATRLLNPLH